MNVVLIGMRGAGKSTVGRLAAAGLGWTFIDTDETVMRTAGRTIREIFEQEGEPEFRRLERAALAEACAGERRIIAAGGGAVEDDECRRIMKQAGLVCWLTAEVSTLADRITADARSRATRPALTGGSVLEELELILRRRVPLYAATADFQIDTQARSAAEIAEALQRAIETSGRRPPPAASAER